LHGTVLAGMVVGATVALVVDVPLDALVPVELELLGGVVLTPTAPLPQDSSTHKARHKLNT
jgi:hypothetical protein